MWSQIWPFLIPVSVLAISFLIVLGAIVFHGHAYWRFRYGFFRIWHFLSIVFGFACLIFGKHLRAGFDRADFPLHGLIFTAVGIALLGWLLYRNCHKTNWLYGVSGTLLEVMVCVLLCSIGLMFVPFLILGKVAPESVIVINGD